MWKEENINMVWDARATLGDKQERKKEHETVVCLHCLFNISKPVILHQFGRHIFDVYFSLQYFPVT